jgi:hypothetical protein
VTPLVLIYSNKSHYDHRPISASDYVADDPDDVLNDEENEYSNGNYRDNQYRYIFWILLL